MIMSDKLYVIPQTAEGFNVAKAIQKAYPNTRIEELKETNKTASLMANAWEKEQQIVFIGSMGICVRSIAPLLKDKKTDPAVICIDSTGKYVIPVVSGHIGGANQWAGMIARAIGATAVITTQSDNTGLWALDTLGRENGWETETAGGTMNELIAYFVNKKRTALLIEAQDAGTRRLLDQVPPHVQRVYDIEEVKETEYDLLIAVTPFIHAYRVPTLIYRPRVLSLGVGCRKACKTEGIADYMAEELMKAGFSTRSIHTIATVDIKKDEPLLLELKEWYGIPSVAIYTGEELKSIEVPNPSAKVEEVTGSSGVSEASAMLSAGTDHLLLSKQKGKLSEGNDFTFAVAIEANAEVHRGHVEFVGAGPGDPGLISIRGRRFLEEADLILYAGSLVPVELTQCAKAGATVRSSADMNLEEQIELMKSFTDRHLSVVRLHTGDPCIYGAIGEQMAELDRLNIHYHITPGISSFQAAAAALKSEFTIPEKVQTIILTRGEGRTPMPEKEKLHKLAASQSTMCIYLSVGLADQIQEELLIHYPPATPVALCYKLTWREEKIYRTTLEHLAETVRANNLKLTTMIVVGEAVGNRKGLSRLYADEFKHGCRK